MIYILVKIIKYNIFHPIIYLLPNKSFHVKQLGVKL